MPLFTDQDRIVVHPGETLSTTIYAENDSDRDGTFTLYVEPNDPNLRKDRKDWYSEDIQPRSQSIAAGATEKFEVRITAKRSPHGSARLIEFDLRATQGGVGPSGPVTSAAAGAGPRRPAPGGLAGIFRQAYDGGTGGNAGDEEEDLDAVAMGQESQAKRPPVTEPVSSPEVEFFKQAPSTPKASQRLISLGTDDDAYVTIEEIPAGAGSSGAQPPTSQNPNDPSAASGSVRGVMIGSLYLFVPPIPAFEVELFPYRPDNKKKGREEGEKHPVDSGRVQGALTVRVSNKDQFPASFRVESLVRDAGSDYHLREQWLRVEPGSSQDTVVAVKPHSLNWWRWIRPFGFHVLVTPLTGSTKIDQSVALERLGAFRQTLAWLHPAPLCGLVAATLLGTAFLAQPSIDDYDASGLFVLREPFDRQYILDDDEATRALKELKITDQGATELQWKVSRTRAVEIQFHPASSRSEDDWQPVALDQSSVHAGRKQVKVAESGTYQLTAKSWFWGTKKSTVRVFVAPEARNRLEIQSHKLDAKQRAVSSASDLRQRLYCKGEPGYNLYRVRSFLSDGENFRQVEPQADVDVTIKPEDLSGYPYRLQFTPTKSGNHRCFVTVVTNSRTGNVQQYEMVGTAQ